jgi:TonB-linked SusC/RagA family outer membrane protein
MNIINKNQEILRIMRISYVLILANLFTISAMAFSRTIPISLNVNDVKILQNTITGTVIDASGEPLPGVNVLIKGTTTGVITDVNGKYNISIPEKNVVLVFSFLGYTTQELSVKEQNVINVVMKEDISEIEEVVVVGYGVQKKKLVTGATVQVKGEDITKLSTINAMSSLQSKTPGVSIVQSSGEPGEGFKVTIRGLGTTGDSSPLYIVDGFVGFNINQLNPSDIESIDVLKDAASASIYGSRASNGVILITTKKGVEGKSSISYDGYFGIQDIQKIPKLLNAKEYMTIYNEGRQNDGTIPYDFSSLLPINLYDDIMSDAWEGTNWLDAAYKKNAPVQNHALNISGGTERSTYSFGLSYSSQDGAIGKPVEPKFDRYTLRLNTAYGLIKAKDFDVLKIGENIVFTYIQRNGVDIGARGNTISTLLRGCPLLPLYDVDGNYYDMVDKQREGWKFESRVINPIAYMESINQNIYKNMNVRTNLYMELQPIKNLIFRTSFSINNSYDSNRRYIPTYNLSPYTYATEDYINQSIGAGYKWMWENTLNYVFKLNGFHNLDILLGQSAEKWGIGETIEGSNKNSMFSDFDHAYLSNVTKIDGSKTTLGGWPWGKGSIASFFGRINYNFKETYLATVVLRADGSSNFAPGKRWGYFPSISAGWVITNENFMGASEKWLDFLKFRASWGQNGNSNIPVFQYLSTYTFSPWDASYYFGSDKSAVTSGAYPDILSNKNVSWETSEQLNIGFDARLLSGHLGVNFDYYNKTTKDWLVQAPQLASYGTGAPYINGGDVQNKGVELGLNWEEHKGDLSYGINLNVSYNKNEIIRIANTEGIINGPSNVLFQASTEVYRAQIGYPMGYFYGYKTAGVFQNESEITNYQGPKLEGVRPGDLIFLDVNGDNTIDINDKTMIGNPHPDCTLGFGMNFGYKGFDFSFTTNGAFGHQIMKSYRDWADTPEHNYTIDIFDRWHGEGTSNKLPRLTGGTHSNWQWISDIYIENADYLKVQNVTLGYDFKKIFPSLPLAQARIYISANNLFTITGYTGMDPEVGYSQNSWSSGIDVGFYPSPRIFLIGANLKF